MQSKIPFTAQALDVFFNVNCLFIDLNLHINVNSFEIGLHLQCVICKVPLEMQVLKVIWAKFCSKFKNRLMDLMHVRGWW